ncbi:MAG: HIT family protein [bacterium]|nr:HIT family protein [bacterium]
MNCLFCDIAAKKILSEIIFEDDATLAFLDIAPRAPGHTLIIPKNHVENVLDAGEENLKAIALTIARVTDILRATLIPSGFTIGINHGVDAGQAVDHLHVHILPRFKGDSGGNIHSIVNNPGTASVAEIANRIRQKKV